MNVYKKLLKNSGIFAIANFGSKLISFILVPYYTYVLSTKEYGTIDMIMTTVSLLLPLITLNVFDATLRFTIKSSYSAKSIFTTSIISTIISNLLFFIAYPLISRIEIFQSYLIYLYLILLFQGINSVLAQFSRGIGSVKVFAANGLINTTVILILNIILLSKFRMGIKGYLISVIIAYLICNLFIILSIKLWRYFEIRYINKKLIKEMFIYCIPLMPNSIMWWVMNASDRYIITGIMGIEATGIYAVSHKIPTILNLLYTIFYQAWQLSAIEEGESKDRSKFYTNVFNVLSTILLIGTSGILVLIKPIIVFAMNVDYISSWRYVPFLLLGVVFSCFASFVATNYIVMKNTNGVFKTSLIGAIINILLNIIFVPVIGVNGATIGTMIGFFVVWILRIFDTKKFVNIKFNLKKMLLNIIIIIIQISFLYIEDNIYSLMQIIFFIFVIIINYKFIKEFIFKIINLIRKK